MCRRLLPLVLLTTITLSTSNVLPILSINKLDTEPLLDDQDSDNTFNTKNNLNPNIFYKVFIDTPKDNTPKISQISRYMDDDNQDANKLDNEDSDDEEFLKVQWHNYPRQLDRLNRHVKDPKGLDKILLDMKNLEALNDINQYINNDVESLDESAIDGPLLVLKIRLAYLYNNINDADAIKFVYSDLAPVDSITQTNGNVRKENVLKANDIESFIEVKRKGNPRIKDITFLENPANEKKTVKKRIFSLWSRLQSLSHRGHELHHRRHLYALYGPPEDGGGTLTAETRGNMMRPPGSPLRWG